jgi:hypothetical protein
MPLIPGKSYGFNGRRTIKTIRAARVATYDDQLARTRHRFGGDDRGAGGFLRLIATGCPR